MIHRTLWLAVLAGLAFNGSVFAQSDTDTEERFRQMERDLEAMRADNERMKDEIDDLRARTGDNWLDEERSDQIRALVSDVLADADVRSSLLNDGLTAGWRDGFFLASPDGRFKLQLEGQMQVRFIWNYHDQPDEHRNGWENTRTNLTLKGHVFSPDITFLVRHNITREEPQLVEGIGFLLDAWMRFQLNDETSVRVGQFKAPFAREFLVSSSRQLAVERSVINESLSIDRTQGIEFTWAWDNGNLRFALIDSGLDQLGNFGLIGTRPIGVDSEWSIEDSEFAIATRYEHLIAGTWGQFEDFTSPVGDDFAFMVGIAGFYQRDERTGAPSFGRDDVEWVAWTVDASAEWGGANAFGSFTHHYVDNPNVNLSIYGFVAQGGVYVTPKVEAFTRFEYAWYDFDNNSFADLTLLTVGANYYIDGHDLKWTTDIGFGISKIEPAWDSDIAGYRGEQDGAEPQVVFRTQFQLLF